MIGGVDQNHGPVVEGYNAVRLLCTGRCRNLKSGIQCELCGYWYYYICGSLKTESAERENCHCDKRKAEKVRMVQEDLQNAL